MFQYLVQKYFCLKELGLHELGQCVCAGAQFR